MTMRTTDVTKKSATFSDFVSIKPSPNAIPLGQEYDPNYSTSPYKRKSLSNRHFPTAKEEWDHKEYKKSLTHNHYYPPAEDVPEVPTNSGSIFLMIFLNFLSNVVFSIVLPSMPDFIKTLTEGTGIVASNLNGYAVAVNSLGTIIASPILSKAFFVLFLMLSIHCTYSFLGTFIASPIFGWWADKRNYREVFVFSLVVMIVSNLWYALASDVYQLFAARFVVGVAAANYAIATAYLSYATSAEERAKVMAWNSASSVLGFIMGPSFALVTSLPQLAFQFPIGKWIIHVDAETYPGYVSALFGILGLISMIPFKEVERKVSTNPVLAIQRSASMRSFQSFTQIQSTSVPLKGILVSLWLQFALTSAFTLFETIGPLYTNDYLGWGIFYTSLMFVGIAIVSLISLMSLQIFLIWFNERLLMIFFTFMTCLGMAIFFNWNNGGVGPIRFCFGVFFASVGYACAAAMLLAVFTKLLDEAEQGVMMGWFSSIAAVARMTVPIAASYAYTYVKPNYIFITVSLTCFLSNIFVILVYPIIMPNVPDIVVEESSVDGETTPINTPYDTPYGTPFKDNLNINS